MRILAIESSAKAASVAIMEDERLIAQTYQHAGLTHSKTLLPMIHGLLAGIDCTVAELDTIAVAKGPGSFTGIRIGVATAKGLALGADKPLVGVSSLEAMAHQAKHLGQGLICAAMDARRGQVYNALFHAQGDKLHRLTDDRAIAIEALFAQTEHSGPYLLVGDGAALCYDYLQQEKIPAQILPEHLVQQTAWGVAMAAREHPAGCVHDANPEYIRPSQAERERDERLQI
ncbi:MAG: tRNA (adenosine(37)-N6)-threonylcarbamoyltransferase complex dimerization subunit type 1 TsaB [Oscillospiraceae bacterium]|nr:tRNA (adenosine(37)-N6)-threonylcarbamoyltransferase complex dimerization subunit type 1 TsaB [Oscillospiraceae bacterium]